MIIRYEPPEYSFLYGKDGEPLPGLRTSGCGCCSKSIPLTRENINAAIRDIEELLETLRDLQPISIDEYEG